MKPNKIAIALLLFLSSFTYATDNPQPKDLHPFLIAIQDHNYDAIQQWLKSGTDLSTHDHHNNNAFHHAATIGDARIMELLIAKNNEGIGYLARAWNYVFGTKYIDPINKSNDNGDTPVHCAIHSNNSQMVRIMIWTSTTEINLKATNDQHLNPLFLAIKKGDLASVGFLNINYDEKLYTNRQKDCNALHFSIKNNQPEMVREFARYPELLNEKDQDGNTPLQLTIATQAHNLTSILLAQKAIDTTIRCKKGIPPLHHAVLAKNNDLIKMLLAHKTPINDVDLTGKTALFYATECSDQETMALLLDDGADPDKADNNGNTPGHSAVNREDITSLRLLAGKGANFNAINNNKETFAHRAAHNGNQIIMQFLIEQKASVNTPDNTGKTPFAIAVQKKHDLMINDLACLENVDVNARDNEERTPLITAAINNDHERLAKLLTLPQIKTAVADNEGNSALHFTVHNGNKTNTDLLIKKDKTLVFLANSSGVLALHTASARGMEDIIQLLIDGGAPINAHDRNKETALHYATKANKLNIITLLLKNNAAITANKQGKSPLHIAAEMGNAANIKRLKMHHASITDLTLEKNSSLHLALGNNHFDCMELLVDSTIINSKNQKGQTPLHLALPHATYNQIDMLIQHGADQLISDPENSSYLHLAITSNNADAITFFANNDLLINRKNNAETAPLHLATLYGRKDYIKILLTNPTADTNIQNNQGTTPFAIAVKLDLTDIIDFFIAHKVNINKQDNDGLSPIAHAASKGNLALVKKLHGRGASLFTCAHNGDTLMHNATKAENPQVIDYLEKNGLSTHAKNNNGETPFVVAAACGKLANVQRLLTEDDFITDTILTALKKAKNGGHLAVSLFLTEQTDLRKTACQKIIDLQKKIEPITRKNKKYDTSLAHKTKSDHTTCAYTYIPYALSTIHRSPKNMDDLYYLDSTTRDAFANFLTSCLHHETQQQKNLEEKLLMIDEIERQRRIQKAQRLEEEKKLHAEYERILGMQNIVMELIQANKTIDADLKKIFAASPDKTDKPTPYTPSSCAHTPCLNTEQLQKLNSENRTQQSRILLLCQNHEAQEKTRLEQAKLHATRPTGPAPSAPSIDQDSAKECCICLEEKDDAQPMPCPNCNKGSSRLCKACFGGVIAHNGTCPMCNKAKLDPNFEFPPDSPPPPPAPIKKMPPTK